MGYPSVTLNIFNDWYARDTSKKIRAVFKAKGQSGKPLSLPIYGYKKSEANKNLWLVDDEAAEVVRRIFKLCIEGYSPLQIARILTQEGISRLLQPTLCQRVGITVTRTLSCTAGAEKLSVTFLIDPNTSGIQSISEHTRSPTRTRKP